jgi:hypothetical protein
MLTPSESIRNYIRAKDENRPHLMKRTFAETATLEMAVKTGTISFPPQSKGLDSITDVLVRRFGQDFENVYTLCLASPPEDDDSTFSCDWLVGMSDRKSGAVRVGCGRYNWLFRTNDQRVVEKLTITIELMQTLSPDSLGPVMAWLSNLPYPWCQAQVAAKNAPRLDGLVTIVNYINRCSA